ncbi:MAG: AbrB/MazE/SpoVT family DNA-binding domain-containing protein [Thermoplasmata archaeon]|nr:MAG: AbrB/MazE/SpoVT family DNA-binding domain-containing protein [Thermoplasmata archaeon]
MECPVCDKGKMVKKKSKYVYGEIEFGEYDSLVCSECGEIFFTEDASRLIEKKAKEIGVWGLERESKISYSGNSMIVRIPKAIADFMGLQKGKEVLIHPEGKKKLVVIMK